MEIFVGNLPFDITEQEIRDKFAECGAVSNVKMLMDKFSGRFRGIAFVSMDDEQQAQAAIETLDGAELGGRPMKVDRSRERTERFNGFGGGFRPRNSGRFDNRRREDSDTRQSGEFRRDGGNFRQNSDGEYRPRGGFRPRGNFRSGDGYRPREGGFKPAAKASVPAPTTASAAKASTDRANRPTTATAERRFQPRRQIRRQTLPPEKRLPPARQLPPTRRRRRRTLPLARFFRRITFLQI